MPFSVSMFAWIVLIALIAAFITNFVVRGMRQNIEIQNQREKRELEKQQQRLQNDFGDNAIAELRKAASDNKVARVLSSGVRSTEVLGPYISSEIDHEEKNSPYAILAFMTDTKTPDRQHLIFRLEINLKGNIDEQVRVLYGPYYDNREEFFGVGVFYNVLNDLCETVRTYRHFRRSGRIARSAKKPEIVG